MQNESTSTPREPGQQSDSSARQGVREEIDASVDAVKEGAAQLRDDAVAQAHAARDEAQRRTQAYAEQQRVAMSGHVESMAHALEAGAETFASEGRESLAGYSRQAALGFEDLAQWLEHKSLNELWDEAGQYARRQPGVAFGGALAAGFALARFLKSTAPRSHNPYRPTDTETRGD